MHNTLFAETGLPHRYDLFETPSVNEDIRKLIRSADFGGASVTMPFKQDIMSLMDDLGPDVKIIGAMNTIIPEDVSDDNHTEIKLIGRNTDWQGMVLVLRNAGAQGGLGTQSGLVIGGGGTARAAIYALNSMGYSPINLVGRSPEKMQALASSFPASYDLHVIPSVSALHPMDITIPSVAIGTIPASEPIEEHMRQILCEIFGQGGKALYNHTDPATTGLPSQRILLEMAYMPPETPLMHLAQDAEWKTVNGLEVLVGQGVYQFKHWTGIAPLYETARVSEVFDCFLILFMLLIIVF